MVKGAPAVAVVIALALSTTLVARADRPPQVGTPAPAFHLPLVANGHGVLALASLHGRPLYLNFFASWCKPCRAEARTIAGIARQYGKRGLVVVGIDELEDTSRVTGFVGEFKLPYQIVADQTGEAGAAYGLVGLPLQVLIAADGRVVMWEPGPLNVPFAKAKLATILSR